MQVEDRQIRLDQALEFQQKYQDALQNISSWLDLAEQKLFNPEGDRDSQDRVRENEALQREIRSLQSEISAMGRSSQDLLASASLESQELIRHSLANLNDRVRLLESQAQVQGDKLRQADRQLRQYKSDVESLQTKLNEIKMSLSAPNPSVPLDQLIFDVQKIDAQLKKCEGQIDELRKISDELSDVVPQMVSPGEVKSLQNTVSDLKQKVMDKKADLLQSVSVKEQYEKMLQDYAEFLETASEKLKVESISVRDLEHLKQMLAAHKDFFSDLEVHRAMLDNLAAQTNQAARQKHIAQHTRLNNLTYVILDKASLHGQKLERLVRQWIELADRHRQLQSFLDDVEQQIPRPVASNEAVVTIQEKINTYRRLQRELNEERPILFQVVDKGKQLLHSLNCPILETEVTELADRFVDLNSGISQELKRSETLGDQLQSFETEATVLMTWLSTAKAKLSGIKHLSDQDQQSIATIRNKVDKLLEFRKEFDEQTVLKNKLLGTGRQLYQNKNYNTAGIQDRMGWVEQQWDLLQGDVTKAEEVLHQAQMDLMPSRQALNELGTWLDIMEIAVRDEKAKPVKNLADIDVVLKKFKDFKIELQSKQLTVDFVNQSVLQSPEADISTPVTSDQTDFAERLGHLNKRWQGLDHDVKQTLKNLETLHNKWQEYERALGRVQEWFIEQEDKVARYHLIGHEVSVKQTIRDCKALQEALKSKEEEIDSVRKLGERLVDLSYNSPNCQESIQASLDRLNQQWRHLASKVQELQNVLDDFLSQWNSYHAELQSTNQILSEVEYSLSRYNKVGADLTTLTMQVDKLKSLNDEMQRGSAGFERFVKLGTQLNQVCEAPVRQEIQNTLTDVQARWRRMSAELRDRHKRFQQCHQQWQQYEEEYIRARIWLENKEQHFNELAAYKDDTRRREDCLKHSKILMKDLDNFTSTLSQLYQLSDAVTKNMDSSSIVTITSRQTGLEQRVLTLRQALAKQIQTLQGDLSQKQRFKDLYSAMTIFLTNVERTLGDEELSKSTDPQTLRNRYDELKNLMQQFNNQMVQLDALNDLGYRMALSEETSKDLRDLNHKWQDLYAETKERNKTLQGLLLVQQDFSEKCDTWMTFLAQTESDLANRDSR
ncbi:hypothetical protein FSP39_009684 [Pinctada imbricata]|uniref:Nesprin-1 n=1 Tax=Pinctada imbricata TaxID=66713 RepID=A0AA88XQ48_PINIB|nr:hypothetical protein FSP39_009684 [Pinctada imbricata]